MKNVFVIVSDEVHTTFYTYEVWEEILMSKKYGWTYHWLRFRRINYCWAYMLLKWRVFGLVLVKVDDEDSQWMNNDLWYVLEVEDENHIWKLKMKNDNSSKFCLVSSAPKGFYVVKQHTHNIEHMFFLSCEWSLSSSCQLTLGVNDCRCDGGTKGVEPGSRPDGYA